MIRRSTWIIIAIFLGLLAVMLYFRQANQNPKAETTPTLSMGTLLEIDAQKIGNYKISNNVGEAIVVQREEEGNWKILKQSVEEITTEELERVANQLANLQVLSLIDPAPPAEASGLNQPLYKIEIELEDGSIESIEVGKTTPIENGYYVKTKDGKVYVADKFGIETITQILDSLVNIERLGSTPMVTETQEP